MTTNQQSEYLIDGKKYREGEVLSNGPSIGRCVAYLGREGYQLRGGIYEKGDKFATIVGKDLRRSVVSLEKI